MKVGVLDYGIGNLGSVVNCVHAVGGEPVLIDKAADIRLADAYILPGVGSFYDCMKLLNQGDWTEALQEEVIGSGKPILGICVGMQLLATLGTEGANLEGVSGLGFIPGRVDSLRDLGCQSRVPHVGWNDVRLVSESGGLFKGISDNSDFYFVHSYVFVPADGRHILAVCDYDITVTAAVRSGSVWGVQFHPEKSSRAGRRLIHNFLENPQC